jgi:hypothetical protein
VGGFVVTGPLQGLGGVLLFLLMNFQIADYYTEVGARVRLGFSGHFARDMTTTIAWSVFALIVLVIGLVKVKRAARWAALLLLSAALLKLFLPRPVATGPALPHWRAGGGGGHRHPRLVHLPAVPPGPDAGP